MSTKNYQVSVPVASDANDFSRFAGVTVYHVLAVATIGNAGAASPPLAYQMLIGPSLTSAVP